MNWKSFFDEKLEEWILIFSMILIILLVFIQVLARYIFNVSVGWNAELSRYILIWITWISTSYAIRKREHIRINLVVERLPPSVQKGIEVIVILLFGCFAAAMAVVGTEVVMDLQLMGQKTSTLGIKMWVVYLIIPIGGVLMLTRLVQQLYFVFTNQTGLAENGER